MLWRTRRILCTDRGKELWTNSYACTSDPSDQAFLHPPTVGEKNFRLLTQIHGLVPPQPFP
ncbi:hypothetical protein CP967_16875 [Streptomyces nitrosporeus]|uniref:Uncharacterized protein n=1 Tax=Streptomyces nitrosporeus TaxID=28894 RepID=A0A5J6FLH8_9ACTN|nr:hypothetical protein CP967_16875 [Streptomyces nitrosporeus]